MNRNALLSAMLLAAAVITPSCATPRAEPVAVRGETAGEALDDATMTTEVNALIIKDRDAHFLKIDVATNQGDVVLQGYVNNRATQDRLVAQIQGLRGVKSVKSLLRLEEKSPQPN